MKKLWLGDSKFETIVNIICLIQLVGIATYMIFFWKSIPDQIPMHYGFTGTVTRWGSKGSLFIMPAFAWLIFLLLGNKKVVYWPEIMTEEDKERIYPVLAKPISLLKLEIIIVLVWITINTILAQDLPIWFLPVILLLIFGTTIYAGILFFRVRWQST